MEALREPLRVVKLGVRSRFVVEPEGSHPTNAWLSELASVEVYNLGQEGHLPDARL